MASSVYLYYQIWIHVAITDLAKMVEYVPTTSHLKTWDTIAAAPRTMLELTVNLVRK